MESEEGYFLAGLNVFTTSVGLSAGGCLRLAHSSLPGSPALRWLPHKHERPLRRGCDFGSLRQSTEPPVPVPAPSRLPQRPPPHASSPRVAPLAANQRAWGSRPSQSGGGALSPPAPSAAAQGAVANGSGARRAPGMAAFLLALLSFTSQSQAWLGSLSCPTALQNLASFLPWLFTRGCSGRVRGDGSNLTVGLG